MSTNENESKTIIAICYDFDNTLSNDNMQSQGYIQNEYSGDIKAFWFNSNQLSIKNKMDPNLAYMYMMVQNSLKQGALTKEKLENYGRSIEFFPGVEGWFNRISEYGEKYHILIEHYIISSGLKEMIEGTTIAKSKVFKEIYASSFYYDDKGIAVWPAQVVNPTNKTQYLFRIVKGTTDVLDSRVYDHFSKKEKRISFRNMIFIGDSYTDIPCMKLVSSKGGHSIGVFSNDCNNKKNIYDLLHDKRIKYAASADYSVGSKLDLVVKRIIDYIAANQKLEEIKEQ